MFTRELKKYNLSDGSVTFIAGGLSATAFWLGAFPSGKLVLVLVPRMNAHHALYIRFYQESIHDTT